jgi:hypothetical protein
LLAPWLSEEVTPLQNNCYQPSYKQQLWVLHPVERGSLSSPFIAM